jgi:4-hydroxy-tetrahydrodipicolinate synthase
MRHAQELERALGVLSSFDEGVDLVLYYKYLMVLEGHEEYRLHINPTDQLSDSQRHYLEAQHGLFKTWYKTWSAALPR